MEICTWTILYLYIVLNDKPGAISFVLSVKTHCFYEQNALNMCCAIVKKLTLCHSIMSYSSTLKKIMPNLNIEEKLWKKIKISH